MGIEEEIVPGFNAFKEDLMLKIIPLIDECILYKMKIKQLSDRNIQIPIEISSGIKSTILEIINTLRK